MSVWDTGWLGLFWAGFHHWLRAGFDPQMRPWERLPSGWGLATAVSGWDVASNWACINHSKRRSGSILMSYISDREAASASGGKRYMSELARAKRKNRRGVLSSGTRPFRFNRQSFPPPFAFVLYVGSKITHAGSQTWS